MASVVVGFKSIWKLEAPGYIQKMCCEAWSETGVVAVEWATVMSTDKMYGLNTFFPTKGQPVCFFYST